MIAPVRCDFWMCAKCLASSLRLLSLRMIAFSFLCYSVPNWIYPSFCIILTIEWMLIRGISHASLISFWKWGLPIIKYIKKRKGVFIHHNFFAKNNTSHLSDWLPAWYFWRFDNFCPFHSPWYDFVRYGIIIRNRIKVNNFKNTFPVYKNYAKNGQDENDRYTLSCTKICFAFLECS